MTARQSSVAARNRALPAGFTLIEMIIVLAVIGTTIVILSPRVFVYVDDAKQLQARGDVMRIAAAIQTMYKDLGRWPFYRDGGGRLACRAGPTRHS